MQLKGYTLPIKGTLAELDNTAKVEEQCKLLYEQIQKQDETIGNLLTVLRQFIDDTTYVVNNAIRIDQNLDVDIVTVADTGTANVQFAVTHTLKRVPTGYFVVLASVGGVVYTGTSAWTITTLYLKCTLANANVTIIVY